MFNFNPNQFCAVLKCRIYLRFLTDSIPVHDVRFTQISMEFIRLLYRFPSEVYRFRLSLSRRSLIRCVPMISRSSKQSGVQITAGRLIPQGIVGKQIFCQSILTLFISLDGDPSRKLNLCEEISANNGLVEQWMESKDFKQSVHTSISSYVIRKTNL